VRLEAHDDAFDLLGRLGGDGELDVGLVGVVTAHVEAVDRVGPRVFEDVVHHAGEDALVDEVSAQLDGLCVFHVGAPVASRPRVPANLRLTGVAADAGPGTPRRA
jgi:hypothetical protein